MAKKSARTRAAADRDSEVESTVRRKVVRKKTAESTIENEPGSVVKKKVKRPTAERLESDEISRRSVRSEGDSTDAGDTPRRKRVVKPVSEKTVTPRRARTTKSSDAAPSNEAAKSELPRAPRGYIIPDDSSDAGDSRQGDQNREDLRQERPRTGPSGEFRRPGGGYRESSRREFQRHDQDDRQRHRTEGDGQRDGQRDGYRSGHGGRNDSYGRGDSNRNGGRSQHRGRYDDSGRNEQGRSDQGRSEQGRNEHGRGRPGRDDRGGRSNHSRRDSSRDLGSSYGSNQRGPGRGPDSSRGPRRHDQRSAGHGQDRSSGRGQGRGQPHRGSNRPHRGGSQNNGYGPRQQRPYPANDRVDFQADSVTAVELSEGSGMLEMHPDGYGFLRQPKNNYTRELSDPFVPKTVIDKYRLRPGLLIRGMIQPGQRQQGPRLRDVLDIDGMAPDEYPNVKNFDQMTPINPEQWYQLETGAEPVTTRVLDLLTPLGKGQRALIVAPPRSGKTVMLQHISNGIAENYPDCKLIVLLVDERPEEVTDMRRNVRGEVVASSLDEDVESHVRLSQIIVERCKRLAEMGRDVFLLLDSITRLARAFNKWVGNTGRTMSGGVDIKAMDIPKKLFATARAFEEGGSLTIVGTALIDTGSRMDELIFQEFKGTGNMELVLDRRLADRRIWPAIDINQSGTRREELLLPPAHLRAVTMLRRTLTSMNPVDAMEQLVKQLGRFKSNNEFIRLISGKADLD